MPAEERKGAVSEGSEGESRDDIMFINQQDERERNNRPLDDAVTDASGRDSLIAALKKSKQDINKVLHKKENYNKANIEDYEQKFIKNADEEIMDVGVVDLSQLETEFGMIEDERDRKRKQRELEFEHRKKGIELTSATTQNKLVQKQSVLLKEIAQEEIEARKKAVEREKIIKQEFQRVEGKIRGVISQQRSKILSYFGPLVQDRKKSAYAILGSAKKKVDLSARTKICLPFSVKIKMLRCVKDKIDAGTYVILAEIIDRIGGAPIVYNYQKSIKNLEKLKLRIKEYEALKLRFLKEQKIEVSTQDSEGALYQIDENEDDEDQPINDHSNRLLNQDASSQDKSEESKQFEIDLERYERLTFQQRHTRYRDFHGSFNDDEFYVDENLYLLYPPMNRARPSNCIQFKVVKLSNETSLDDKVVGWGVFPILNSELAFNEGRFKIPLLQGDVDEEVTLYRTIQGKIMKNLDTWLCNMYFEVEPLLIQKLVFDMKGKEMYYEKTELNKQHGAILRKQNNLNDTSIQQHLRNSLINDNMSRKSSVHGGRDRSRDNLNLMSHISQSNLEKTPSRAQLNRQQTKLLESVLNEEQQQFTKQMEQEIRDELDDDNLMLETYTYSVSDKFNYETRNVAKKKLVYIFTESLADMGLKNMNTIAFQITLFVIILSLWSRLYLHYFGEYLALIMIGIPVSKFDAKWYTITLYYEAWEAYHEVIVICLGVLFNTLLFSIFLVVAYFVNKYTQFPHIFYKMICWYGIGTTIDFLLIFIVDCIEQRWDRGDMFKLYYYYNKRDSNGWPGLAITLF